MDDILSLLRSGDRPRLRGLVESLVPDIARAPLAPLAPLVSPPVLVRAEGFHALPKLIYPGACVVLSDAIDRLLAAGLPASFVFLLDLSWWLGESLAASASSAGVRYHLAADVWAWRIPLGEHGWPAHRGVSWPLDRDRPELLNTWVALSDVEADRACMHFVALDDDPAYPTDLASIDVPPGKAVPAPLAAGEALVWNANTLHWGGECAPNARGPRVSCSFSLVREDAVGQVGIPLANAHTLEERLDLIARQIVVYGEGQPDVRPEVLEWARATVLLAMVAAGNAP